jgi:hypothetical protein
MTAMMASPSYPASILLSESAQRMWYLHACIIFRNLFLVVVVLQRAERILIAACKIHHELPFRNTWSEINSSGRGRERQIKVHLSLGQTS